MNELDPDLNKDWDVVLLLEAPSLDEEIVQEYFMRHFFTKKSAK